MAIRIAGESLSKCAPHVSRIAAVAVVEGRTGGGIQPECGMQVARDDLAAQGRALQHVEATERLRDEQGGWQVATLRDGRESIL